MFSRFLPAFLLPLIYLAIHIVFNPFGGDPYPVISYEWIPEYGINFTFAIDHVSWAFGLLVTLITLAVFGYASKYMQGKPGASKFWIPISIFYLAMMAMLGSDDLLFLFIFWELTSICSYFLITFDHEQEAARKSALMALFVTGSGGLLLLVGITLLGVEANTFSFIEIMQQRDLIQNSPYIHTIMIMFILGAFTKSAQFPFHFWLPNAMAAPAPVSALLHSATMVKAGYYLLLKFSPLFQGLDYFGPILIGGGAITMIFGAVVSATKTDLKSVLAYTTINGLGTLMLLIGIGSERALQISFLFFVVHAIYKSALFMVVGNIDKVAGTRSLPDLEHIQLDMLPTRIVTLLSVFSMAGLPLCVGFLAKEEIYGLLLNAGGALRLLVLLAIVANAFLCAVAIVLGYTLFVKKREIRSVVKEKGLFLYLPGLIISVLGVVLGCFPGILNAVLAPAWEFIAAGDQTVSLSLWHGFTMPLLLSALTLLLGVGVYRCRGWLVAFDYSVARHLPSFADIFNAFIYAVVGGSKKVTDLLQNERHDFYLRTILCAVFIPVGAVGLRHFSSARWDFSGLSSLELLLAALVVIALLGIVISSTVMNMAIYLGLLGISVIIFFALYGGPDLAMTQSLVEILSILLLLTLATRSRPRRERPVETRGVLLRDLSLALLAAGGVVVALHGAIGSNLFPRLADEFAQLSLVEAHGRNIVNVILVDFRGYDTFGESMVIVIATLGILLMFKGRRGEREEC